MRAASAPATATLFITCFNDTLFPETGRATVEVLERLGCEVRFPEAQTCCGQMHGNSGFSQESIALARRFVRVFADEEVIVCPSASCAGFVREHYLRLARLYGDGGLAEQAHALEPRVLDISEFLVDRLGIEDVGASFPHRVTWHPTCHSLRALALGDRPQRLLRAVHGLELVDLPEARECCGFGGTFAIKNADTSMAMLADKVRCIMDTKAEVVTASDTSCLMHIGGALRRLRAGVRSMHITEILAAQE